MSKNKSVTMTQEQCEYVDKLRHQGYKWPEVAELFNNEYKLKMAHDAIRKQFGRRFDDVDETLDTSDMKKLLRAQITAKDERERAKKALSTSITLDDILHELKKVPKNLEKIEIPKVRKLVSPKSDMTIEALFGDLQIGKIMDDYNSTVAGLRMKEYTDCLLLKIHEHRELGYNIEKIIVSVLGDLIECSEKHFDSARATDYGTPEQMRSFVEYFYKYVMIPLAKTGLPIEFNCVTGNHENPRGGLVQFYPGREHLSWTMYNYLKLLAEATGMKNVKFNIAVGAFLTYEIYGKTVLIEHGVGIAPNETAMAGLVQKRANAIKKYISYFRMGDKHHVARFNNDKYVVNGAFFGADDRGVEYSGINGFYAPAAQVMFCHVPRDNDDARTTIYDSFVIQLQHIK